METDKRIIVYDTETGKIKRNLPYSENNILIPLGTNENLSVVPSEIKLSSFIDPNDKVVKAGIPENITTEKNKSHKMKVSGPLRYSVPRQLQNSTDVSGKIILGGQHVYAPTLSGFYYPISGGTRYEFNEVKTLSGLKLLAGDYFQILNTNISVLDGIYEVRGSTERSIDAFKVTGTTTGSSGPFSYAATGDGFHMIRLQAVDGVSYGMSADVEGSGVYQYNERLSQSKLKVVNVNNVIHDTSVYKYGGGSAYFPNSTGSSSTASYLYINYDDGFTPRQEVGDGVYFKLSFWIKFAQSSPASDMFIIGQREATANEGMYYLKYESSPKALVFTYSSNDSGADFDNSFTHLIPSLNLTQWNHIQIEVAVFKEVRLFINGELVKTDALSVAEATFDGQDAPFVVGANTDGTESFYGYLDEVEVQWLPYSSGGSFLSGPTGSTMAIGATIDVPAGGNTGTSSTGLILRMNGPNVTPSSELFTEDGFASTRSEAVVSGYDHDRRILTISGYGGTASAFSTSKGYIRGYNEGLTDGTPGTTGNSEAIHPFLSAVIGITAYGANLANIKKVMEEQQSVYHKRVIYATGMEGNSGACGDFYNLFGVSGACAEYGARTLTFAPTDEEVSRITAAVIKTQVNGVSLANGYLEFVDISGVSFNVNEVYLPAFHSDVNTYREGKDNTLQNNIATIESATSIAELATSGKNKIIDLSYSPYGYTFPSRV